MLFTLLTTLPCGLVLSSSSPPAAFTLETSPYYARDTDRQHGNYHESYGDVDSYSSNHRESYGDADSYGDANRNHGNSYGDADRRHHNYHESYGDVDSYSSNHRESYGEADSYGDANRNHGNSYGDADRRHRNYHESYGDADSYNNKHPLDDHDCSPEYLRSQNEDVLWYIKPSDRQCISLQYKVNVAKEERDKPVADFPTNHDEERYPARWGNFHKSLPHDSKTGRVVPSAYNKFVKALHTGTVEDMLAIPKGGPDALLGDTYGGGAFPLRTPDTTAIGVKAPPSISSQAFGANLCEVYCMAVLRDVPFYLYDDAKKGDDISKAMEDLTHYTKSGALKAPTHFGSVTSRTLFRGNSKGVTVGPYVSQFFFHEISVNGLTIDPRITKPASIDFMTHWDEYIAAQDEGIGNSVIPTIPGEKEYIHKPRDLGLVAGSDVGNSLPYFLFLLIRDHAPLDPSNPYSRSNPTKLHERLQNLINFGNSNFITLLTDAYQSERAAWYVKWHNRYLRPEAGAGLVEAKLTGRDKDIPLDKDIFNTHHLHTIKERFGSYLMPQMFPKGSPTFPSYVAGHGIILGACVTVLKAIYDTNTPWDMMGLGPPVFSKDGTSLHDYRPTKRERITLGTELNKFVENVVLGRDMSGVHYRVDDDNGALLGEEIAIRVLREEKAGLPEPFTYWNLQRFDGTWIRI